MSGGVLPGGGVGLVQYFDSLPIDQADRTDPTLAAASHAMAAGLSAVVRGLAQDQKKAIALYKKAITLSPNAAQYREYLGEYYHSLKRSEEALATWRPIAEGPNRTSKNLARLAEVFAGFGYRKEAVAAMADAVSLEKDDFTLRMTYAELLRRHIAASVCGAAPSAMWRRLRFREFCDWSTLTATCLKLRGST